MEFLLIASYLILTARPPSTTILQVAKYPKASITITTARIKELMIAGAG